VLAIFVALLTAKVSLISIQAGCTVALVVVTVGLYARDRTAGLVAVWLTWLLAPFIRRIFLLSEPLTGTEPLALAPFLVTAVIVGLEIQQVTLSKRARRMILCVAGGYAVGMPMGFVIAPPAAVFAFFAYITAAGCFVIGYREAKEARPVLSRLMIAIGPFLALYAFRQYYVVPLPEWDSVWQKAAQFETGGSPEAGRIRVWGTLNSPGTFALVMAFTTICYLTMRRLTPWAFVGLLTVLGALALTYVRSAWVGLVIALIAIVLVSRGAALKRVVPLLLLLVVLGPVVFGGSTGQAIGGRVGTFGSVGQDQSAGDRTGASLALVPFGLSRPGGVGIGQAGEATRLGGGGIRVTDNGYLSTLLQVGPFGFLLVMIALVSTYRNAWRNARRRPAGLDLLVFAVMTFFVITLLSGDAFYGFGGMIFWYFAGIAVRRYELAEVPA
jgi:hypothetical protein